MSYVNPTSGGLHQNHALTKGSMWDDLKFEMGMLDHEDEVAMGRAEDTPGFVRGTAEWGWGVFTSLAGGMVKGNFG